MNDFIVEIKKLAATCEFKLFLTETLRDRLVCGMRRENIINKLLTEGDDLTFEKAIQLATAYERAEKDTQCCVLLICTHQCSLTFSALYHLLVTMELKPSLVPSPSLYFPTQCLLHNDVLHFQIYPLFLSHVFNVVSCV